MWLFWREYNMREQKWGQREWGREDRESKSGCNWLPHSVGLCDALPSQATIQTTSQDHLSRGRYEEECVHWFLLPLSIAIYWLVFMIFYYKFLGDWFWIWQILCDLNQGCFLPKTVFVHPCQEPKGCYLPGTSLNQFSVSGSAETFHCLADPRHVCQNTVLISGLTSEKKQIVFHICLQVTLMFFIFFSSEWDDPCLETSCPFWEGSGAFNSIFLCST